jgi:EAL domain-containing protein (putative c-di-GMP-specific phosphodiesterase class I)
LKPDGSLVSAGEFIPVAEQLGLSRLIDRRVQELAVDLLRQYPTVRLAVNVSGLTASDHEWLVALHRLTGGRKQLLQRLTIEITETAAIQDLDQSIAFVDTLKELGCSVAIDDFGAGYTSFKNLKLLKVDMVKIDGGFVKNLADDSSDQVFIKTLIELANTFGMATVAEWVTNEKTVEILEAAGITYMQGFHFSRPMPAEHFFLPTATAESA